MVEQEFEKLLRVMISGSILDKIGFEDARKSSLVQKLRNMKPSGGTAMRDSLLTGMGIILELHDVLSKLGTN